MAALLRRKLAPLFVLGQRGVRALRRSPVRVLPPVSQQRVLPSAAPPPPSRSGPKEKPKAQAWEEEQGPRESEPRYEKAGPGDKRLSKVVTLAKSRAFREKHGKILLEGRRLILDALEAGAAPQTLFFSSTEHLKELPAAKLRGASLIKVNSKDLKDWSDVVTSQGAIGIFSRPDHAKMTYPEVPEEHQLPLSLICDNIRDPGNLGTILRSAAGAGCSRVLLVKGCVDAWEPKVLRAGMGAHFRLPIVSNLEWDLVPNYLLPESCVYVADGSHAAGPQTDTGPPPPSPSKACSHGWVSRSSGLKPWADWDRDLDSQEEGEDEKTVEGQCCYDPWMDLSVAVVIGGETHGVSEEAMRLAQDTGGRRLLIPIAPGVDSLNAAMAASILLFEAKRQLRWMQQIETTRVLK
ncbi:rRNA methyltransferase 3, mitochondrial [Anolis carolinensis]|uniref:RNA 2-O ribose methyltransferase substrate binding domain-containing protein n=1 Tax=Anolis carolinensis TaxID=28377 RepID=H9GMT3_ANOCA|nr:PREDICTED: rRNA methyltransferase 3, mitochondrial [Anolis carolinensis]|eukprot:XP_003229802.1 PREDICTED: rRNA methyltransferase 3, mitochondrial [Anolis carolinensis]